MVYGEFDELTFLRNMSFRMHAYMFILFLPRKHCMLSVLEYYPVVTDTSKISS